MLIVDAMLILKLKFKYFILCLHCIDSGLTSLGFKFFNRIWKMVKDGKIGISKGGIWLEHGNK